MTLLRNDLGDLGTGVAVAQTDPGDPNAFDTVTTTGGTIVRDSSIGSLGMWAKVTLSAATDCLMQWNLTASHQAASHAYGYMTAYPSAAIRIMGLTTATPTTYFGLFLANDGKIGIQNNAGTTLFTSVGSLSLSTVYRIEIGHDNVGGAAAGIFNLSVYPYGSTSLIANLSTNLTGQVTGTGNLARAYAGRSTGTPTSGTLWFGALAAQDSTVAEIGEATPQVPPQRPRVFPSLAATQTASW